jgi:hypothetical protein
MKTIRVEYLTKTASSTDLTKTFEVVNGKIESPKTPNCHAVRITDTVVDMLVPDDFDVSTLGGTIVKSDGSNTLHEFLGHDKTRMVVDKTGTTEEPVKTVITEPVKTTTTSSK